jgi:hypothetical protein
MFGAFLGDVAGLRAFESVEACGVSPLRRNGCSIAAEKALARAINGLPAFGDLAQQKTG